VNTPLDVVVERIGGALGQPRLLVLFLVGATIGYLLFQRRWARPWSHPYRTESARFAGRVTRAARIALGPAHHGGLTRADLAALEAFYTRWLNLASDDREAHREALRAEGIDMIRLGDALRRLRSDEPP
jgi:hypothetical protein